MQSRRAGKCARRSAYFGFVLVALLGASRAGAQPTRAPEPPALPDPIPALDSTAGDGAARGTAARGSPAGDTATPELEPEPGEIPIAADEPLAEVIVHTVRKAPGSFHAVPQSTLQRYHYDNPHQVLGLVPGVYMREEDGFGLRPNIGIRGSTSDRSKKVALMEDGVSFAPAPYSAPAAYYFPMMPRVYQMRVIKGPAGIEYGPQTVGGAIDFITRPIPYGSRGALDLAFGQYGYGKLHAHYGSGEAESGFAIEGVHLRSDGFKQLPSDADTGFHRNEWAFKGKRTFGADSALPHDVSVKLTYSDEVSNESYLGLTDADFRDSPQRRYAASAFDRMAWYRTSVVLSHHIEPGAGLSLTTSVYRHDLARVWRKLNGLRGASVIDVLRNPDTGDNADFYGVLTGARDGSDPSQAILIGPNDRQFVSQGIQLQGDWQADGNALTHRVQYGLRFHNDRVARRHSEDAFRMEAGQLVAEGGPTAVTTINAAESHAVALHALDTLHFRGFTLTPGLRIELIRQTYSDALAGTRGGASLQVFLPGAGVHYALTPEFGLLAGVHRGMSPPSPGAGSPEPELSVNYEAGARYMSQTDRLELIGYYNDYSNLADQCTFSSGCTDADLDTQISAGRARIYGFEAVVEHEILLPPVKLPISASYTLTLTEFLETFQSEDPIFGEVEAGDELPYVPQHQGRVSIAAELDRSGLYLAGSYTAAMREQSGQGPIGLTTDRQVVLEAGAHHDFETPVPVRAYLQAQNLLDDQFIASRRPFGARPNPPFMLQVGAKLSF